MKKPAWWQRPAPKRWAESAAPIKATHVHVFIWVCRDDNSLALRCACGTDPLDVVGLGVTGY